jgi:hypothetical protein
MQPVRRTRAALLQGVSLTCILALLACALLFAHLGPFNSATLEIQSESVASQAAEFEATEELAARGALSARWSVQHLGQLQTQVQKARKQLASKDAPPGLAKARSVVLYTASQLDAKLTQARNHPPRASP